MTEKKSSWGIKWFFLALFISAAIALLALLSPFLSIIVIALLISSVFKPLYSYINYRTRPFTASIFTCMIIFVLLFIPIAFLVGIVSKEAYDFYLTAKSTVIKKEIKGFIEHSDIIQNANSILSGLNIQLTGDQLNKGISELGKQVGLFLYRHASSIASNAFGFFIKFFIMLIVIFFLFIDGHKLISFLRSISPLPAVQEEKLIDKFKETAFAILVINGLSGLIQGTLGGIVFTLFGFKSALLWGIILGLAAFLPVIGIPAVFIPVGIYLMLVGRFGAGCFFIVFCLIVSITIDNMVKPKLLGDRVKIHPLVVFLSIIGGLKLFGPLGIIYGPLVVTAFLTLADIYHSNYQFLVENDV